MSAATCASTAKTGQRPFRILRPIKSEVFLAGLVARLESGESGAEGNGVEVDRALLASGKQHFMSCTCENYMHYLWCLHVCCHALSVKLIKGVPRNLDPTKIHSLKQKAPPALDHRPPKAIKGDGLGGAAKKKAKK